MVLEVVVGRGLDGCIFVCSNRLGIRFQPKITILGVKYPHYVTSYREAAGAVGAVSCTHAQALKYFVKHLQNEQQRNTNRTEAH